MKFRLPQDDKNIAHLTHVSEMEKKCESLARITTILKDVIQNKVMYATYLHYFIILAFFLSWASRLYVVLVRCVKSSCECISQLIYISKIAAVVYQDRIIARLQQPYSLDCIPVEAEYQVIFLCSSLAISIANSMRILAYAYLCIFIACFACLICWSLLRNNSRSYFWKQQVTMVHWQHQSAISSGAKTLGSHQLSGG